MMKRVLCLLLVTLMCASVFFVSCDKSDDDAQETNVIKSSRTVFDEMASVNLMRAKRLIAEYLKNEGLWILQTSFDDNAFVGEMGSLLEGHKVGIAVDVFLDQQIEPMKLNVDFKDGLIYGTSNGNSEETYVLLRGTEMFEFDRDPNGEWYLASSETIGIPTDASDTAGMSEILTMLQSFSFVDITPYDIAYKPEKEIFVLSNTFLAEKMTVVVLANEGLTVLDVDKEMLAEMVSEFQNMLDSMNLVVGFEMHGTEFSAAIFSIDVDSDAMQELEMVEPGVDAHAKLSITYRLTDDGSTIQGMSVNVDMYQEDELDMDLRFDADLIYGVDQLRGMKLSLDMTMNGMSIDHEFAEDDAILGDMCFSTELSLDFGAVNNDDLMALELFYELDNIRATSGAFVNEEEYEQLASLSCKMTVKSFSELKLTGTAALSGLAEELASDVVFSGKVFLDSAPNFPAEIPPIIQAYME